MMDFQRATQCYLWAMPIVSFAKWQQQHETVFGQEDGDLVQLESFRDRMGFLTPNDTTTYLVGYLNLERTGPLVIDYPQGPTAGGILDMWQRPITDLGLAGPDRGEGGKYLILPPGGKAPQGVEGYRVFESGRRRSWNRRRWSARQWREPTRMPIATRKPNSGDPTASGS